MQQKAGGSGNGGAESEFETVERSRSAEERRSANRNGDSQPLSVRGAA